MSTKNYKFETLQLHVGQEQADPATDARAVPIYQTTSYVFRNSFEDRVAALEGGVAGLAVASGAAAITYALQNIVQAGDHIVAADNLYGGSYNLITHTLSTQGISNTILNVNDLAALEAAIQPNTKVIYAETFGNPNSDVLDLEGVAAVAHKHGIPFIVDNTFGTPYLIRPLEHGADMSRYKPWWCHRGWWKVRLEAERQVPHALQARSQLSWYCVCRCSWCSCLCHPHPCRHPA